MTTENIKKIQQNFVKEEDLYTEIESRISALFEKLGISDFNTDAKAVEQKAKNLNPMALMNKLSGLGEYLQHLPEAKAILALCFEYFTLSRETRQLMAVELITSQKHD